MDRSSQPYRSVLYIPGSNARAIEKSRGLPVDAIIFDLEDAVTPDAKLDARKTLRIELAKGGFGTRRRIVRINGFDTDWGMDDLAACVEMAPDAVLIPKVETPDTIAIVREALAGSDTTIWAMMETPKGILNASAIAAAPAMEGFVMGTNDLAKELGSRTRGAMLTSLQLCLLAARGEGLVCVDGVYNAFKDEDGLRDECTEGRDLGFDGKTLIHPAQVAAANDVFGIPAAELDLARRQIEAFEAAVAEGKGVAVVDGKIVENLHVATARQVLARAQAIAALETA
jgi:(3S)-malyl-CoA thioesterase